MREIEGYEKIDPWESGQVVAGMYVGATKPSGVASFIHSIKTATRRVQKWGTTMLDAALGQVNEGDYVIIRCEGKKTSDKARAEFWAFRVVMLSKLEYDAYESGKLKEEAIFKGEAPAPF